MCLNVALRVVHGMSLIYFGDLHETRIVGSPSQMKMRVGEGMYLTLMFRSHEDEI